MVIMMTEGKLECGKYTHRWEFICWLGYEEEGKKLALFQCKDCNKIKADTDEE